MASLTRIMNAPPWMQRLVALALPLLALYLLAMAVLLGLRQHAESIEAIVGKRERLGQLIAIGEMEPALRNAAEIDARSDSDGLFLTGQSEAVILAELQGRVSDIAARNGVTIQSVANLPIDERAGIRYAGVGVDVQGNNRAIFSLIYEFETTTPFLLVRNASFRGAQEPGGEEQRETQLFVRLEIYGALAPDGAEGGGQ
ncbi:MAG: hypothetical protein KDJ80_06925 [Nitratireductor sp.]|nr:hypothetical protein [Nitratireductor sp.]